MNYYSQYRTVNQSKGNYSDDENFESRFNRTCRSAYAEWLNDPTLNVAMTLNFNPRPFREPFRKGDTPVFSSPITLKNAKRAIGRCFAKVDRNLLGRQFTGDRDRHLRITGVFAFEHAHSNLHAHGLLRVQPDRLSEFEQMFPRTQRGLWTEVWPSGSQWTTFAHAPGTFAHYFTKEQRASSAPDAMFFLEDFFPPKG